VVATKALTITPPTGTINPPAAPEDRMTARPRVALEFVDERGNVVVAVDSGARFGGTLRRVVEVLEVGSAHDVMLIFGDEPATMVVSVVHGGPVHPGAVAQVEVVTVDVGGIRLAPPPPPPSSSAALSVVPSQAGLVGHLGELPMAELVQLLCATRRTATVELTVSGDVVGVICFADGRAVFARTTGGAVGVDAFYGLAALERGEFAVYYGRGAHSANITEDALFLLLEAARRADEARRNAEEALALETLASLEDALDGALDGSTTSNEVDAPVVTTAPPPLPRRPRPADARGEPTQPGRRASGSGLFSGFFEEFSEARASQQRESREQRRERRARERSSSPRSPRASSDDGGGLRVVRLSELRTDDIVAAPPFASLAFAADHSGIGDRDTDIIAAPSSAASGG
jgi:hypothetical protein